MAFTLPLSSHQIWLQLSEQKPKYVLRGGSTFVYILQKQCLRKNLCIFQDLLLHLIQMCYKIWYVSGIVSAPTGVPTQEHKTYITLT